MLMYAVRRVVISIPILLVSSFIVFWLGTLSGNPLTPLLLRNPPPPQNVLDAEAARLNLDQPLLPRYLSWLGGVLRGDFGPSVISTQVIGDELAARFWVTMRLIILAMVIALVLAVVVGVWTSVRQYSKSDYTATFLGFLFLAMPSFWLAILLKQGGIDVNNILGVQLISTIGAESIPPEQGFARVVDIAGHLVLPTIALALISYASWSRFTRASMLETLNSDYVRLARAKGLSRRTVMVKHALRTALIPLTTVTALDMAAILGGAVVTERVFQWRGLGDFLLESIKLYDTYAVASWLLVSAVVVIAFNLVADLLYGVLDPRIRYA
ncbi:MULTISPECIES: ABC transporter permease [Pseudonocardia]|uniref:Dipeptide transport system permease protein DppB n=2 Tax=Pseudonocardia TaxID=1847 RepID=A0A1Y2N4M0_PSEAH|nr:MULTISPECIES: ABC transporter permease [Pseudonocardia]OSY42415.1 Dipeptide transport system permease protein DppB [Pseudonocardia autotrophica]TDN75935.1 peptide/nickel transport system permease protein [Pseudonocardia autotrophica]BBF99907.1 peptide ABC transporter permease [Pseudonocardia autotrophica]GEC24966.1 peptide ABC transporter permease [Pseudonocardia saturnea]